MAENEDERMAREIAVEERKGKGPEPKEREVRVTQEASPMREEYKKELPTREYRPIEHREQYPNVNVSEQRMAQEITSRPNYAPVPREPQIRHPGFFGNQKAAMRESQERNALHMGMASHYAGRAVGAVGGYAKQGVNLIGQGVSGAASLPGKYQDWQRERKIKDLKEKAFERNASGVGKTHEEIEREKRMAKLKEKEQEFDIRQKMQLGELKVASERERINQFQAAGRRVYGNQQSGFGLGGGLGGGFSNQNPNDPFGIEGKMPNWMTGRQPEQQQVKPYGQKSYEYPTQGGQPRVPRAPMRQYRDPEAHELAERNRMLKSKSKQLRKLARRERAIANREQALEQYKQRKQAPPPQQGGNISNMLFGGGQ